MKDNIILKDNDNTLQITIEMKSIIPCLRSIQQYKPHFKPQDITKEKWFSSGLIDKVTESFNECLYELIENNTPHRIQTETKTDKNDSIEFEQYDIDF